MSESLAKLYEGCRSYRRFQRKAIPGEILHEIVETARTRSSAMNQQAIRYIAVGKPEIVSELQPCIHWAGKLPKEIGTPRAEEQPTAFVVVLTPEKPTALMNIDVGIAVDTMAVDAWSHGIGSCILAAVEKRKIAEILTIPEGYEISLVVALGYPAHTSTLVHPDEEHGLSYYVDADRNYYVPKRPSEDVITYLE